jgi:hypothetical protein
MCLRLTDGCRNSNGFPASAKQKLPAPSKQTIVKISLLMVSFPSRQCVGAEAVYHQRLISARRKPKEAGYGV